MIKEFEVGDFVWATKPKYNNKTLVDYVTYQLEIIRENKASYKVKDLSHSGDWWYNVKKAEFGTTIFQTEKEVLKYLREQIVQRIKLLEKEITIFEKIYRKNE